MLNLPGISALRSVIDWQTIDTATAQYAQYIIGYFLPLIMIPYLARTLRPETWGVVVFSEGVGMYLRIVRDYSFEMPAMERSFDDRRSHQDLERSSRE